jgi:hypothetical protein
VWWDLSDADTVTADGDGISEVADKTESGNTLSQTNSTLRPAYGASTVLGGRQAAIFDIWDDIMTGPSITATAHTTFIVTGKRNFNYQYGGADVAILVHNAVLYVDVSNLLKIYCNGGYTVSSTYTDWTVPAVFTLQYAASQLSLWRNTTLLLDHANVGSISGAQAMYLGNDGAVSGDWDIGEVVRFPSALSDAERLAMTSWLRGKWGV